MEETKSPKKTRPKKDFSQDAPFWGSANGVIWSRNQFNIAERAGCIGMQECRKAFEKQVSQTIGMSCEYDLDAHEDETGFKYYHDKYTQDAFVIFAMGARWLEETFRIGLKVAGEIAADSRMMSNEYRKCRCDEEKKLAEQKRRKRPN